MKKLMTATKITRMRGEIGLDYEEGYKPTETENEDIIHRDNNINKTETNWGTSEEVTKELPDIKSPAIMEVCINEEIGDNNQNALNEENRTGLDE